MYLFPSTEMSDSTGWSSPVSMAIRMLFSWAEPDLLTPPSCWASAIVLPSPCRIVFSVLSRLCCLVLSRCRNKLLVGLLWFVPVNKPPGVLRCCGSLGESETVSYCPLVGEAFARRARPTPGISRLTCECGVAMEPPLWEELAVGLGAGAAPWLGLCLKSNIIYTHLRIVFCCSL